MKKEQEIVRKSREMEAIENANKFGILPGEKPLEVLQDASNASTGESSTTTAQIPQGAPLLVNPVNSTLVPLVDSEKPKPLEEVQTIDVIAKDVEDDDEDLGLFGGFNSSSDDEEIDQNKETQESPTKRQHTSSLSLARAIVIRIYRMSSSHVAISIFRPLLAPAIFSSEHIKTPIHCKREGK